MVLFFVQELELLDQGNNPLTHAKYHQEKVMEAGQRERRPFPLEIPAYLEQHMRDYLTQVSSYSICLLSFSQNVWMFLVLVLKVFIVLWRHFSPFQSKS